MTLSPGNEWLIKELKLPPYQFTTPKWNKITVKMHIGQGFLCVQMGTYFIFLQLLLFCEEILLEKYPIQQLTMPSCSVVKQNQRNCKLSYPDHS